MNLSSLADFVNGLLVFSHLQLPCVIACTQNRLGPTSSMIRSDSVTLCHIRTDSVKFGHTVSDSVGSGQI